MKLNSDLKSKIQSARENLAASIGKHGKLVDELAKLEASKPALESEIAKIESSVIPDDEEAINRVVRLREKAKLTENRISFLQRKVEELIPEICASAEAARKVIRETLSPEYDKLISDAITAFAPFYKEKDTVKKLAESTDAAYELFWFIQGPKQSDRNDLTHATSEMGILDTLLAGKAPWNFTRQA